MKSFFLGTSLMFSLFINAQSRFVIDFDSSLTTFNSWGGTYFSNTNDPENASNAVGTIYNSQNSEFGGVYYDPLHQISMDDDKTIRLDFFNSSTGMVILKFKLEGQVNYEVIKFISGFGWHNLTFDFSNALNNNTQNYEMASGKFLRMTLMVNPGQNIEGEYHIDNIDFPTVVTEQNYSFNELVWFDECDGSGPIDTNKWFHQTLLPNGYSWFNGEIQHYTDREQNSFYHDGNMHISAIKETYTNQNVTKNYTSARLNSKFAFRYGKVEIRAQLPYGVGTWPALWMLGKNITENGGYWAVNYGTTPWPNCGEVDIMEHWGHNQDFVQSALHNPSSYGGTIYHGGLFINEASTSMHTYVLEWTPEDMRFYVDGINFYNYNPLEKTSENWPYDQEMYLLLNIAIQPSIEQTTFTQSDMIIDYIRVYDAVLSQSDVVADKSKLFYDNANQSVKYKGGRFVSYIRGFDLTGKNVINQKVNSNDFEVNISFLKEGFYIFHLEGENTKKVFKIFKY